MVNVGKYPSAMDPNGRWYDEQIFGSGLKIYQDNVFLGPSSCNLGYNYPDSNTYTLLGKVLESTGSLRLDSFNLSEFEFCSFSGFNSRCKLTLSWTVPLGHLPHSKSSPKPVTKLKHFSLWSGTRCFVVITCNCTWRIIPISKWLGSLPLISR